MKYTLDLLKIYNNNNEIYFGLLMKYTLDL